MPTLTDISHRKLGLEKLSEKGYEQRPKREFGCYREDEMGRKSRFRWSVELRCRLIRDFSDSFSTRRWLKSPRGKVARPIKATEAHRRTLEGRLGLPDRAQAGRQVR